MSVVRHEVRPGAYYDSVVLMQLQRALAALPGVLDAGVVMATTANLELLAQSKMLPGSLQAHADDLLLVVRAEGDKAAHAALAQVDELLARRRPTSEQGFRPHSLESALRILPEAGWVLVSVPGRYAAGVARQALQMDRHVFLYSDNVPLEEEVALKKAAEVQGLLVMGPDCGTAVVNGVGLGFANRVRRGPIGLVGASGTGLQAVLARIHNLGGGVSHALGTGGHDLGAEVGGRTARQAIDLLSRDPQTRVIVLVSKPPDPQVAGRVLSAALATDKPTAVAFIGYPPPARRVGQLHFAASLSEAAEMAVEMAGSHGPTGQPEAPSEEKPVRAVQPDGQAGYLRGLFSGGTLASETLRGLQAFLDPLYSNVPLHPRQRLPDSLHSQAHSVLDLGADEFTVGRLHPMIDNDLRLRRLRQEAADPQVALILLDVVLGDGAHPDPAAELAPAIAQAHAAHGADVVVLLIGTDEDPQDLNHQRQQLTEAGAHVFQDSSQALTYVVQRLSPAPQPPAPVPLSSLSEPLAAINVGLEAFYESLIAQGATAVQMDWRPPAGGDERLAGILERLRAKGGSKERHDA